MKTPDQSKPTEKSSPGNLVVRKRLELAELRKNQIGGTEQDAQEIILGAEKLRLRAQDTTGDFPGQDDSQFRQVKNTLLNTHSLTRFLEILSQYEHIPLSDGRIVSGAYFKELADEIIVESAKNPKEREFFKKMDLDNPAILVENAESLMRERNIVDIDGVPSFSEFFVAAILEEIYQIHTEEEIFNRRPKRTPEEAKITTQMDYPPTVQGTLQIGFEKTFAHEEISTVTHPKEVKRTLRGAVSGFTDRISGIFKRKKEGSKEQQEGAPTTIWAGTNQSEQESYQEKDPNLDSKRELTLLDSLRNVTQRTNERVQNLLEKGSDVTKRILEQVNAVGEKFNELPKSVKYSAGAALAIAGAVGGSAIAAPVLTLGLAYKAVASAGTYAGLRKMLEKSYEKAEKEGREISSLRKGVMHAGVIGVSAFLGYAVGQALEHFFLDGTAVRTLLSSSPEIKIVPSLDRVPSIDIDSMIPQAPSIHVVAPHENLWWIVKNHLQENGALRYLTEEAKNQEISKYLAYIDQQKLLPNINSISPGDIIDFSKIDGKVPENILKQANPFK